MAEEKKKLSPLTLLAGAGAAVTSMLAGSFFGAAGTIAGAALSSVTYSVGAFFYEDRARKVHAALLARREHGKSDPSPGEFQERLQDLPLERSMIHARTEETLRRK